MDEKQAAEYLSESTRTLQNWRQRRQGPPWIKIGYQVRYDVNDLDAWIESLKQVS
jgi:predicted DNA-binding transcriptional regulator AlpA